MWCKQDIFIDIYIFTIYIKKEIITFRQQTHIKLIENDNKDTYNTTKISV